MKRFTGQSKQCELNRLAGDNIKELADAINSSLKDVSNNPRPLDHSDKLTVNSSDSITEQYVISPENVFCRLQRINVRKAPGPDGLPNWILRDYAILLCDPICAIFNASVQQGRYPSIWKMADVIPSCTQGPFTNINTVGLATDFVDCNHKQETGSRCRWMDFGARSRPTIPPSIWVAKGPINDACRY